MLCFRSAIRWAARHYGYAFQQRGCPLGQRRYGVRKVVKFHPEQSIQAQTFAELALELHDAPSVEETIEAVLEFALKAVGCRYASAALAVRGGRAEVGAATDPVIEAIEQLQIDTGEGPMITALHEQGVIRVDDSATDSRWPEWAVKITELGIGSVLHVSLGVSEQMIGVLGLYCEQSGAFDADDLAVADILARHASVAVATARQEATMARAVDARKLIGQAMGILMMKFDVDSDQAFAVLKRYSQDNNRKLRDVAREVIDTRKLPT
jgi:GAF domain-containing protein